MRRLLLAAAGLLVLAAPSAFAQGGINLFWDDCSPAGIMNRTFACNTNTGSPLVLVASVISPLEVPQLVAAEVSLAAISPGPVLPPWWQVMPGQCRAGAVTATCDPTTFPAGYCADLWGGALVHSAFGFEQNGPSNQFRIRFGGAVATPVAVPPEVVGSDELIVGLVRISKQASTGAGACSGCLVPACFVLESVKLVQPVGQGDYLVANPATINFATYNSGLGPPTCYVPTRNRTWGAIKSLYR